MRNEAMDAFVERVRTDSDIVSVVSSYVTLKKKGNRYWGCCPFHHENTPSFSVVPEQGFFYCFGCHVGGNVFKFLSLIENVSYFEAIKLQAEKLHIPLPQRERSAAEIARDRKIEELYRVHELAQAFFHNCLTKTHYGEAAKAYLAGRGIGAETIEAFGIGCAPLAWDKLAVAFQKRGVSPALLEESGLIAKRRQSEGYYDRFRDRVIIPIRDARGRVAAFGGRILADGEPKYLNSPETAIFNKRRLLFGLDRAHRAIARAGFAIVVEGYMDAISVAAAGIENVVASLGTAFTAEQAKLLLRYAPELRFSYDSDAAGQEATLRALSVARAAGAAVKVLRVPDGKDPDEYIRKHGKEAFQKLIEAALPFVEYRMVRVLEAADKESLQGRLDALSALLPVFFEVKSPAELGSYIVRTARELTLDEGLIRAELGRAAGSSVQPTAARETTRRAFKKADDALQRAGRIVLAAAWREAPVTEHIAALVPFEAFPTEEQTKALAWLHELHLQGEAPTDARAQARLGEAVVDEISRALAEDTGAADALEAYDDAMRRLRKAYLAQLYEEHTRRADRWEKENDARFLQELAQIQRIKNEMEGL